MLLYEVLHCFNIMVCYLLDRLYSGRMRDTERCQQGINVSLAPEAYGIYLKKNVCKAENSDKPLTLGWLVLFLTIQALLRRGIVSIRTH